MTSPVSEQMLKEIRERDAASDITATEYHKMESAFAFMDRRALLSHISALESELATVRNDLQASQCAEAMASDDVRALRAEVGRLREQAALDLDVIRQYQRQMGISLDGHPGGGMYAD